MGADFLSTIFLLFGIIIVLFIIVLVLFAEVRRLRHLLTASKGNNKFTDQVQQGTLDKSGESKKSTESLNSNLDL